MRSAEHLLSAVCLTGRLLMRLYGLDEQLLTITKSSGGHPQYDVVCRINKTTWSVRLGTFVVPDSLSVVFSNYPRLLDCYWTRARIYLPELCGSALAT